MNQAMVRSIRRQTLWLALIVSLLSVVFFYHQWKMIFCGIWIGAITGLAGFEQIVRMTLKLGEGGNDRAIGVSGYMRRYVFYALVFLCAISVKINPLALLAGMLCHKGSILLYTFIHRKEAE